MLEIKPDMFTHTSEYFDQMIEFCGKLLHEGKAYVDDTEPEQMKQEREQRIESKNRNNSKFFLITEFFDEKVLTLKKRFLAPSTYLVGKQFTIADFAVFSALYANQQWQALITKKEVPVHLQRWYNYISSQDYVQCALSSLPDEAKTILNPPPASSQSLEKSQVGSRQQEGKFVELPGAEMGKVVVRFPPEASGYLHIGHAKAALLNQYYQQTFQGKLIMRFDDTNPAKEDVHFEKVILEDVAMLEI
ncbi:Glutathione S-transferase, partial [Oryctes borbonicus]